MGWHGRVGVGLQRLAEGMIGGGGLEVGSKNVAEVVIIQLLSEFDRHTLIEILKLSTLKFPKT